MIILCIDLKSFYASVECAARNLDPFSVPLVVADTSRGPGSVVLAVTPYLKKKGVKSRGRIFELPKNENIIFAKPRMKKYIETSSNIYDIYLDFVDKEDIHVYSIDEAFLDITSYLKYYSKDPVEIAKMIMERIYEKTNITATCGIGPNLYLAKVALDVLSKKDPSNIGILTQERYCELLWDHTPLTDFWGIGTSIEKRLERMNIHTMREISLNQGALKDEFGVIGQELYEHSLGIDDSTISSIKKEIPSSRSFGHSQVLLEDTPSQDIPVILREMTDEISTELVLKKLECKTLFLQIGYSFQVGKGGFSASSSFDTFTNSRSLMIENVLFLYQSHIEDFPVRSVSIRVSNLIPEGIHPTNLFEEESSNQKEHELVKTVGELQKKFGKNSVLRAESFTKEGNRRKRNQLIGGHNAE